MDGELVRRLYHHLRPASAPAPRRGVHADALVVFLCLLAAAAGRSLRWARRRGNLPPWLRAALPAALPSDSTMSRRLRPGTAASALLAATNDALRGAIPGGGGGGGGGEKVLDGKPLAVSAVTRDPDAAARGRVRGGWAKGYKLHALVDAATAAVDAFRVTPLDAGEATVAREMVAAGPRLDGALVRADANYDSNPLYAAVADRGGRLLAPRRKPGTGLGHSCDQHPDRLRAIAELEASDDARRAHARRRVRVEQVFGHVTNLPCGLAPLPNHVRRLRRVTRWVTAKLALYHMSLAITYDRSEAA
jgi:IS5 family transposase